VLTDQSIWQLYTQTLSNQAQLTEGQVFSVAGLNTYSGLGSPLNDICNWCIYLLGNGVPSPSGTYSPHSGLFSAYWLYLSYLLQSAAARPSSQLTAGPAVPNATDFDQYRQLLSTRLTMPPVSSARLFSTGVDPLASTHQALTSALSSRAPAIVAALNQCWLASQQEANVINMPVRMSDGATAFLCPGYALENWATTFLNWKSASTTNVRTVLEDISLGLPTPAPQLRTASASAPQPWPSFLELYAAPSAAIPQSRPILTSAYNVSIRLELSMEALDCFVLTPAAWLDRELFDAPRYPLLPGAPPFLDANGPIGLLPTRVMIGFRPNLTMHTDSAQLAEYLAGSVTRIGPFGVQASTHAVIASAENPGTLDVHFNSTNSDVPLLLGVISAPPATVNPQ